MKKKIEFNEKKIEKELHEDRRSLPWKDYIRYLISNELNNKVSGSVVECGFGAGFSAIGIINTLAELNIFTNVWLFDSFDGFPKPSEEDFPTNLDLYKGWKWRDWSNLEDSVLFIQDQTDYPPNNIRFIEGYFQDTIPKMYDGSPISILHLDCDLYESYVSGFKLYEYLEPGGVIMIDEYDRKDKGMEERWPGALRAIREFMIGKPCEIRTYHPLNKYYIKKLG